MPSYYTLRIFGRCIRRLYVLECCRRLQENFIDRSGAMLIDRLIDGCQVLSHIYIALCYSHSDHTLFV